MGNCLAANNSYDESDGSRSGEDTDDDYTAKDYTADDGDRQRLRDVTADDDNQQLMKHVRQLEDQLATRAANSANTRQALLKTLNEIVSRALDRHEDQLNAIAVRCGHECRRFESIPAVISQLAPVIEASMKAFESVAKHRERLRELMDIVGGDDDDCGDGQQLADKVLPELVSIAGQLPEVPDLLGFYGRLLADIPLPVFEIRSQLKKSSNNNKPVVNKPPTGPPVCAADAQTKAIVESRKATTHVPLEPLPASASTATAWEQSRWTSTPALAPNNHQSFYGKCREFPAKAPRNQFRAPKTAPVFPALSATSNASISSAARLSRVPNGPQTRLLVTLRERYSHLSDDILMDSMAKTKAELIRSGGVQGFTGMKVSDIIARIGDYIDKNVDLFFKSTDPPIDSNGQ